MDSDNIKIGEGRLKLQFQGEAEPTDIGHCRNCDMDFKVTSVIVKDGLNAAPVDKFDSDVMVTFELEFMEATMRNLIACMGDTPANVDTTTEPGTLIYKPSGTVKTSKFCEATYEVVNAKDKTKKDIYTIYRGKFIDGIKFSHRKDKELIYKGKLLAFADPNHNGAPYQIQYNAPI